MAIRVKNPIVEIDGDEMARVIWGDIKKRLILPYLEIPLVYFDLSMTSRDNTNNEIVQEAAQALLKHNVGVKCATITADEGRVQEFGLKEMWPSPNGILRHVLDGTIFREPIIIENIPRLISHWKKPIVIGRHGLGDQYQSQSLSIPGAGTLSLRFKPAKGGAIIEKEIVQFSSPGVAMGMYNIDKSIMNFARSCFRYGLTRKWPVYLSTKNTILQSYDGRFKNIFSRIYKKEFKDQFEALGLSYEHRLIDDMVACALRWEGGFIWACKNYDGDVQSDFIAQGFGSLGLMTSCLLSSDGKTLESEAAHGTVTRHFRQYQKGKETSTNPIASIFAWTRALKHRALLDETKAVSTFATCLEKACIRTVKEGNMTKDLALLVGTKWLTTHQYMEKIEEALKENLQAAQLA